MRSYHRTRVPYELTQRITVIIKVQLKQNQHSTRTHVYNIIENYCIQQIRNAALQSLRLYIRASLRSYQLGYTCTSRPIELHYEEYEQSQLLNYMYTSLA